MADGKKSKKSKADAKPKGDSKPKGEKRRKAKASVDGGVEALTRLVDHPLVTDLLAVGAMAAVAAIAEHGVQSKTGAAAANGSRKAVKAAGKAAAAAIGQRLLKEVGAFGAKGSAKKA
jgi:hypothetical protein